ncbi:MAG: hypothetical protein R3326_08555, partial [Gemmatimonadota bacterium]|nr:hypothetical protein [Gemmatimonadota bacterium]
RTLLKLSAEPLGLAVRDAAMQENYGTVGSYLDRIAGIEGVEGAVLAVGDTIRVSTDATQAGRALSEVVPGGFETGGEARVVTEDGTYRAAVPITGLNERIGTLVLTYVPADPGVDVADEAPGEDESPSGSAPADTAAGE